MFPQLLCTNSGCPKANECRRMKMVGSNFSGSYAKFDTDKDGNCLMFVPKPGVAGRVGGGIVEANPLSQGLDWSAKSAPAKAPEAQVAASAAPSGHEAQPARPDSLREEMRGSIA